ncbi:formate/nitrite transporter family protein [Streptomyces sp. NPDC004658]|uniref:formate/nitrite transporter family protein n=1 Tax=Streptomyces sp. NPDC004658 TaxID=3154672 RepID=UPI0033A6B280
MPLPLSDALADQGQTAADKVLGLRSPAGYLISSMLAGAYIGVAAVLLLTVAGPLQAAGSPYTKLVEGAVFGIALTLVIFAGAELTTGNMMTSVHGIAARRITVVNAVTLIVGSYIGNLLGSALFSWLVYESGVLDTGASPGHPAPAMALLAGLMKTKAAESGTALFFRGVLCNFLVCLAVWTSARTRSDGAKLALVFWCLLAFVGSGFEHVVANMTYYWLGLMEHLPGATAGHFARNLLLVGLGNLVGGALLAGATYGFLGRARPRQDDELPGDLAKPPAVSV